MIHAFIQHSDKSRSKMVLQSLINFVDLKDVVLFTSKSNPYQTKVISKNDLTVSDYEYYQRRIDTSRTKEIKQFVIKSILDEKEGMLQATLFPTSMILAIDTKEYQEVDDGNSVDIHDDSYCQVTLKTNVFIVDGQHRMMAMKQLYEELISMKSLSPEQQYVMDYLKKYKFNCTILVNYDLWEQGQVFINVNFKQKPVNKSLYYEVFGSQYREDKKDWVRNRIYLAHCMAAVLNNNVQSPFYHKVKMLGTGDGYISQAFIVESLLPHFNNNGIWQYDPEATNLQASEYTYFATELLSFFIAVKQVFSEYWPQDDKCKATLICKTTGFGAFSRLMGVIKNREHQQIIADLKNCTQKGCICQEYIDYVVAKLEPLKPQAQKLFGEGSEFASSSGKGAESKLFKRIIYELKRKDVVLYTEKEKQYPFNLDRLGECIQEYMWLNVIDELDMLGHHYETEEISELQIVSHSGSSDAFRIKCKFEVCVNIFLDNEDFSGMNMHFPAVLSGVVDTKDNKYELETDGLEINVNTDEYYK